MLVELWRLALEAGGSYRRKRVGAAVEAEQPPLATVKGRAAPALALSTTRRAKGGGHDGHGRREILARVDGHGMTK